MRKRISSLIVIFIFTTIAWVVLGGVTTFRTYKQNTRLKSSVGQLWGTSQNQNAPSVYYQVMTSRKVKTTSGGETTVETKTDVATHYLNLESSDIDIKFDLDYRKKGLLWYSTYKVDFSGYYTIRNTTSMARKVLFDYVFPKADGIYDNFAFVVNGKKVDDIRPENGVIKESFFLSPGETRKIRISYRSQGMDEWWYVFGYNVSQVKNFNLDMTTDFKDIDFPENSISPTAKKRKGKGWELNWKYSNLISGIQIGMKMPHKLNPGPFASRVSFFAPVSLFLFFFLMFIITTIKKIKIHPMSYFFIAASFFSFHLLMSYLVDHINVHLAFIICSLVSIFLVISYMRLVVGIRFSLIEVGISQFVYLVLFSYAFFLEGFTGLAITIMTILTLFAVMQFTGKIDWEKQLANK